MPEFHEIALQPLAKFKKSVAALTPETLASESKGDFLSPFHNIVSLAPQQEAAEKLIFLFAHAKRLKLDPSVRIDLTKLPPHTPDHLQWDNTPLHYSISYENYDLIPIFLEAAKKHDFKIDLDRTDKHGKTPFMFALQMGLVPFSILRQLITSTNYNKADSVGRTPMMIACAMRRLDVAQCLLQLEADRLKLGELNFSALTKEQNERLSPFVNQKHIGSGKSLAHFALLRHGSLRDQAKDTAYQETILNILKAVGIDGNRDVKAIWNAITNETNCVLNTMDSYVLRPAICHVNDRNQPETAILACKANIKYFENHYELFTLIYPLTTIAYVQNMLKKFEGVTLGETILKGSAAMIDFLHQIGVDISQIQTNGKTPLMYVEALHHAATGDSVTKADSDYLIPLRSRLISPQVKDQDVLPQESEINTETVPSKPLVI